MRVFPSRASDALIRALGATPVHISGDDVAAAVADGEIDGVEAALGTNSPDEGENVLTTNLPLFPKTLTLFAGCVARTTGSTMTSGLSSAGPLGRRQRTRPRTRFRRRS